MRDPEFNELRRKTFVQEVLANFDDGFQLRDIWGVVVDAMEYVGGFEGWAGADKKLEVLAIVEAVLDATDSPGPDWLVDKAILWAVEVAIDYIHAAAKGKYNFG